MPCPIQSEHIGYPNLGNDIATLNIQRRIDLPCNQQLMQTNPHLLRSLRPCKNRGPRTTSWRRNLENTRQRLIAGLRWLRQGFLPPVCVPGPGQRHCPARLAPDPAPRKPPLSRLCCVTQVVQDGAARCPAPLALAIVYAASRCAGHVVARHQPPLFPNNDAFHAMPSTGAQPWKQRSLLRRRGRTTTSLPTVELPIAAQHQLGHPPDRG
mmetsp:Transcript_56396/g.129394  ORF Transcript_56396/g.129394 Transcript_56396/m.129394 type:complete len:210 (+) Transcript_56396:128-757(+)